MKTTLKLSTVSVEESFPQLAVLPAVDAIRQIAQQLGNSTYKRENLVKALGYTGISGAASRKVAALVHFELLRREGHSYLLTELGRKAATIESEEAKIRLYKEVFQKSYLFRTLYGRFEGLPIPERLEYILVEEYALSPRVAEEMVEAFRESLGIAQLLSGGVIGSIVNASSSSSSVAPIQPGQRVVLPSGIILEIPQQLTFSLALGRFKEAIEALEAAAKR